MLDVESADVTAVTAAVAGNVADDDTAIRGPEHLRALGDAGVVV